MARFTVYFIAAVLAGVIGASLGAAHPLFGVWTGLAVAFILPLVDQVILNFPYLKLAAFAIRAWRENVRVSASYLYRIELDGEYLLVFGSRFQQYQPVGGVYKRHPSSMDALRGLGVLKDDLLKPDAVSEGDLRLRVPGRRLVSFVRWFESERGRETDGWREFYEELVEPGYLPAEQFKFVSYDRVGRIRHMRYSPYAKSKELLVADVLELVPTANQLDALRELKAGGSPFLLWATDRQIERLGAEDGRSNQTVKIAETAGWITRSTG